MVRGALSIGCEPVKHSGGSDGGNRTDRRQTHIEEEDSGEAEEVEAKGGA